MKKEIGGYLELEESTGQEYYPELCGVNLGRTALLWLMEARNCKKIYLPTYLCDSVTGACEETKVEIEFYHMDEKLCPLLPEKKLPDGEYLYLVNYYGQLTDDRIRQYRKFTETLSWIIHTHFSEAFAWRGYFVLLPEIPGVSDGAYLSTDASLHPEKKPLDHSMGRLEHILGRYEYDAGTFYQKMLDNAADYHEMEIRRVSRLTGNLLRSMDYPYIKAKREENYHLLTELLPSESIFNQVIPEDRLPIPIIMRTGWHFENGWPAGKFLCRPTGGISSIILMRIPWNMTGPPMSFLCPVIRDTGRKKCVTLRIP